MEKTTTKYTTEGFQALLDEMEYLKGEKTEEVKKNLAFARSLGDLSENSEYDAAKNEQGQVAARIAELEELIKNAEIISDTEIEEHVVNLGSTVMVYDEDMEEEVRYEIVGTNEVDSLNGKISDRSPIGAALIGKIVGDEIVVATPGGDIRFRVLSVERTRQAG